MTEGGTDPDWACMGSHGGHWYETISILAMFIKTHVENGYKEVLN